MNKELYFNGMSKEKIDSMYIDKFGEQYNNYRLKWDETNRCKHHPFPIQLDIEVIDACNLSCTYCFRHKDNSSKLGIKVNSGTMMSLELYKKIIAQAKEGGVQSINLGFSGECLLHKDLSEMINMAHDAGIFDIRILTNGILLTNELTEKLLESKLTLFSLSVDATTKETYKKLKGIDGLDKVHKNIKYLYSRKKEKNLKFPIVRVTYYISPDSRKEIKKCIENLSDCVDLIHFKEFLDLDVLRPLDEIDSNCRMPFQRLSIYANGNVAACCTIFYAAKMIIGNINESTLQEIWDSGERKFIRDGLESRNPIPTCIKCLQTY